MIVERFVNVFMNKKDNLVLIGNDVPAKRAFLRNLRNIKRAILERDWDNDVIPLALLPIRHNLIPERPANQNLKYHLKCNPLQYFPCMLYMMRYVESQQQTILSVFPLRTCIIPKYICLDTAALICLFGRRYLRRSNRELKGNVNANEEYVWSNLFKLESKIFKTNRNSN